MILQARGLLGTNVTDCLVRLMHFTGAAAQLATKAEKWCEKMFFSVLHVFQHKMTSLAFAGCVYNNFFQKSFFGVIKITHFLYCHG